jgi:NTP pyrophosphatase (non-canonical NTP hydrolase)
MRISDYQRLAKRTAIYPRKHKVFYPALGLAGEAGEVANKVKKIMRGDKMTREKKELLGDEIGDVLWYAAQLATDLGMSLEEIATGNISKLWGRWKRNKIKGSGDKR